MRFACVLTLATLATSLAPPAARGQEEVLRLVPGDRVRVEVAGDSALSGDFDIDAEGTVLVPIAGFVDVGGRPFSDVRSDIQARLAGELIDTPVRVVPLLRVPVLGEVARPGLFWVDPTMTLPDVLAVAGGLTESARRDDIRVERASGVLLIAGENPAGVGLLPRDRIFVGKRSFFAENAPLFIGAGASVLAALVTSLILR